MRRSRLAFRDALHVLALLNREPSGFAKDVRRPSNALVDDCGELFTEERLNVVRCRCSGRNVVGTHPCGIDGGQVVNPVQLFSQS